MLPRAVSFQGTLHPCSHKPSPQKPCAAPGATTTKQLACLVATVHHCMPHCCWCDHHEAAGLHGSPSAPLHNALLRGGASPNSQPAWQPRLHRCTPVPQGSHRNCSVPQTPSVADQVGAPAVCEVQQSLMRSQFARQAGTGEPALSLYVSGQLLELTISLLELTISLLELTISLCLLELTISLCRAGTRPQVRAGHDGVMPIRLPLHTDPGLLAGPPGHR